MDRFAHTTCPYCGKEVGVRIRNDYRQKSVVTCDKSDGGCDRDIVLSATVRIEVKALKIEGEDERDVG